MIDNPQYISKSGRTAPINLGINVDPYNRENELCSSVWYEGIIGVQWEKSGTVIKVLKGEMALIKAYPTPDMLNMVVISYGTFSEHSENAAFLNDEAQVIFRPKLPDRLSKKDKWLPKGSFAYFDGCGWSKLQNCMYFDFPIEGSDFIETRFFNCKQMEWEEGQYEIWRL